MELSATDLWDRVLEAARQGIAEQSYRTWLAGTSADSLTDGELHVSAPSAFHVEWIEDKFQPALEELVESITGQPLRLVFHISANASDADAAPSLELAPPPIAPRTTPAPAPDPSQPSPPAAHLNQRYTFDRFVVGSNNQLAAAACRAVAEKPARMYNPLFLYGGVGLGKTHLMHAIGNEIVQRTPAARVLYVSSEQFMNELVTSIMNGSTSEFRRRYRQMDLLLVDDVHFMEGKDRTQEEFFHTFNALYDAQKQIILTSDRSPKEMSALENRLVSRFEWGLVADIKPPDYETRVAILRKKAADDGLILDDDVIDFVARSCSASVRELEGAVIKLLAYSSLKNQEITVRLARAALSEMLRSDEPAGPPLDLDPARVREVVARYFGVRPDALMSKRRTKDLTVPRQIAMYLIKELLDLSLVGIGEQFGGRDHSTVIHSIRKVEYTMRSDPAFAEDVQHLRTALLRHGTDSSTSNVD